MSTKIALVIGATGLVGQALVHQLAQTESIGKVVAFTRRSVSYSSAKIDNQIIDFDLLEGYTPLFQGDYLFSCMGTTRKQAGSIEAQRKVDVDYQFNAAKLAVGNGVRHYLLISSSGANAKSNNAYLKMKGELEQKIQTLPFNRISIFQPSLLLGKRTNVRMGEKFASWVMPAFCQIPGLRRFRPITDEQVAARMIWVSQNPGPPVEFYTLDEIFMP